jgi:hypothetical protein
MSPHRHSSRAMMCASRVDPLTGVRGWATEVDRGETCDRAIVHHVTSTGRR